MLSNQMSYICENEYNYFLEKANVVGLGIGNKIKGGIDTLEECISVLVEKKSSINNLQPNDIVPKFYKGIKTDVIEVGEIKAHALTAKVRPVIFGYSIGPWSINGAGTASCLVTDGNYYYVLSNNHVLAGENTLALNTNILQPAVLDGGRNTQNIVAKLSKYIPIYFVTQTQASLNIVDCAIARVTAPSLFTNLIYKIGQVKGVNANPLINMKVKKVGRSTELTTGIIKYISATIQVGYSSGKTAIFTKQIITTAMSSAGDSGSLLVDNNNLAVGLLFAGSTSITAFNPIANVLSALSVKIV